MHPTGFRLLVTVSFLINVANAALGLTFDNIDIAPVDGGYLVTPTAIGFGIIAALHGFLFFFFNPARYLLAFLLIVFIAVAFVGVWPRAGSIEQLELGMIVLTAIVGGAMTAVAFSGDIGERFKHV